MGFWAYGILAPCRNKDEKIRIVTMMNLILEVVLSRDLSRLTEPVKRMIKYYKTSLEYYILNKKAKIPSRKRKKKKRKRKLRYLSEKEKRNKENKKKKAKIPPRSAHNLTGPEHWLTIVQSTAVKISTAHGKR